MLASIATAGATALAVSCGTGTSGSNASQSQKPSSPPAAAPATLSAQEQTFVSAMRNAYSFGSSVSDLDIAGFGRLVCTNRGSGISQSSVIQTATSTWGNTTSVDGEAMVRLAEQNLCPAQLPAQTWHVIARYSGTGNWNSGEFTSRDSPARVTYSYSGNTMGYGGDNFIASLTSSTDDLSITNEIAVSGGKTTTLYPDLSYGGSPRYHLEVMATGSWSFTVKQKY